MNVVDFRGKVGIFVIVDSECPMSFLVVPLDEDTLKRLFLASGIPVVVVVDSLDLAPAVV
jgi:signal recognition particle receptor subunit beta